MGHLLSSPRKTEINAHDKAVLDLKIQRDKLKQYQRKLQTVINRELEIAKHHLQSGDKRRAVLALRKKRFQEQLIVKTDDQLMNLESLTQSIEYALVEQQVLSGLKEGTRILQLLNREMRLEDVEKLMGDTEDAIEYQQEIERTLVGDGAIDLDNDEELMRELQAIETMEADGAALALPSVPTNDVIAASPLSLSKVKSDENKMVSNSKTAQALLAT